MESRPGMLQCDQSLLNMNRYSLLFIVLVGSMALPQQVFANAGTPLMWVGMIHLVIGNALIGLLEGLALAWWFRIPRAKAVGAMIAANYTSAWCGGLFIRGAILKQLPMDLTNAWFWFWVMVGVTFGFTLLLEFPFVAWGFRGVRNSLAGSVKASLVLQSSSYLILFGWYWMASGTSLYTKMHVVAAEDLSLPESVLVYFIAPSDGHVYRRSLTCSDDRRVYELHSKDENDRLFIRPCPENSNRWDLMARLETGDHRNPRFVAVLTNLHVTAAPDRTSMHTDPPRYNGTWFSFGQVQSLRSSTNNQWEFWAGFWPVEGLRASRKDTGEQLHFSYETPFGAWTVRNAVHLPTDKVLFQLGDDQICGFDPTSRRLALLWYGRGPVAVIEKEASDKTVQREITNGFAQIEWERHRP